MTRENAQAKGRRLLVEGRLTVQRVGGDRTLTAEVRGGEWTDWRINLFVKAKCRGDSGEVYQLGYDPRRAWYCTCPAKGVCSHLVALQLVVVLPVREGAAA